MNELTMACKFCLDWSNEVRPAEVVAGQYTGGDDDLPATWVPVCGYHFVSWFDEVDNPLPYFNIARDSRGV